MRILKLITRVLTCLLCLGLLAVGFAVVYTLMHPNLHPGHAAGSPRLPPQQPIERSVSHRSAKELTGRNQSTPKATSAKEHTAYNYFVQHDDPDAAELFRLATVSIPSADKRSIAKARGLKLKGGRLVLPSDLSLRDKWAILVDEMQRRGYQQRLPDTVIIGLIKSGTTAPVWFLELHPQLRRSFGHESRFFELHYSKGLEYYRSSMGFSKPHQRTFEKSPMYFVLDNIPQMLRHDLPESTQLILCVRDPVERLLSYYRHISENDVYEVRSPGGNLAEARLETAASQGQKLEELLFDSHGELVTDYSLVDHSTYAKYFKRWLAYFPRDRIHILSHERVVKDLYAELKSVEEFLGLEPYFQRDMFYYDEEKHVLCMVKKCPENTTPGIIPKAQLRPESIKKLRDYFRPHNREFEQLTQMTFTWTNL